MKTLKIKISNIIPLMLLIIKQLMLPSLHGKKNNYVQQVVAVRSINSDCGEFV